MSLPVSKDLASLVLSAKANQLGHDILGTRGRRLTTVLLVCSTILGLVAGFGGLADLVGKAWVSGFALAAGLATACVILALTTLKPNDHLRVAGGYERLILVARGIDEGKRDGQARVKGLRQEFDQLARETRASGIPLSPAQVSKYQEAARTAIAVELGGSSVERAEIIINADVRVAAAAVASPQDDGPSRSHADEG